MLWYWWIILLFVVGVLEFFIDQYQKITLARLKFWPSVGLQTANQYFTFLVNVYAFGTIMTFWNQIQKGIYDFTTLIPYLAYVHGCIVGTGVALLIYKKRKKKQDKEHKKKILEKARLSKKEFKKYETDVSAVIEEEDFDDLDETSIVKEEIKAELKEEIKEEIKEEQLEEKIKEELDEQLEEVILEDESVETKKISDQVVSDGTISQKEENKESSSPSTGQDVKPS
jgi:hypothetical protein